MQQYISAYVDGEKDPFAMYVNAGAMGAAIHMLLVRAGVPLPTVLKFMSQPVIQQYYKLKNLQSVSNQQSSYKQPLTEREIVEKIKKVVKGLNKASKLHKGQAKTLKTIKVASGGMMDYYKDLI